eukprot:867445-Amphidinium_carterae.1
MEVASRPLSVMPLGEAPSENLHRVWQRSLEEWNQNKQIQECHKLKARLTQEMLCCQERSRLDGFTTMPEHGIVAPSLCVWSGPAIQVTTSTSIVFVQFVSGQKRLGRASEGTL